MTVCTFQTAIDGADPFHVEGPATLGSGVITPQFKLGHVSYGDCESEFVYCKYTSVANLVLIPGLLFTVDDDYTATLLTTTNSPRGSKVMVSCIGLGYGGQSFTTVTGSIYYLWLARSGQFPISYSTVGTLGDLAETTATGGQANFPDSATVGSKKIVGLYITKAVAGTFTGTTVNTSTVVTITGASLTADSGPSWIGSALSATGIAAAQTIASLVWSGIAINQIVLSAAATASGTVTITNSKIAQGRMMWPYIDSTN